MKREVSCAAEAEAAPPSQSPFTDTSTTAAAAAAAAGERTSRAASEDDGTARGTNGSVQNPPPTESARVRAVQSNALLVYTRNKRLKSSAESVADGNSVNNGESNGEFEVTSRNHAIGRNGKVVSIDNLKTVSAVELCEHEAISGEAVNGGVSEGDFVIRQSEMVEVEVKELTLAMEISSSVPRRWSARSALKRKAKNIDIANGDAEGLKDVVVMEAGEGLHMMSTPEKKPEMKTSKKIEIKGRPTTVLELFQTGLLEGYPVIYNGGKKGVLLRGVIKDIGILCFCNYCKGAKVIPPSQFEIHAVQTYKRASQYICLDNGKSLLDVVKECRKCSLKALEETIQDYIGPAPVKESIVCRNCKYSFLATSAAIMDPVCDECVVHIRKDAYAIHTWRQTNSINANSVKPSFEALETDLGLKCSKSSDVHAAPKTKGRRRKKRKSSKLSSNKASSVRIAARKKSLLEITESLPRPALFPKAIESVSVHKLVKDNPLERTLISPYSSTNASTCVSPLSKAQWKITKRDLKMHKLVFEEGRLPDGTEVAYYSHGKKMVEGYKKGEGIFCFCCNTEVSPSQFEAHAGWTSRRKPYGYIYTSNGLSLHEFAISVLKGHKYSAKENYGLCFICADGGKLVQCDGCPMAFHKECASLSNIPRGKWYCKYCQNMFQREKYVELNMNAVAAGRISGIDSIEQIEKHCIRIMRNPEAAEVVSCVICRGYDYSKSGFGPRTVILCDQCEREYHVGCLKKSKKADLKELPKEKWFCSLGCKSIYYALQQLLNSGEEKLPASCLDVIKKKHHYEEFEMITDFDVRWRLLSGKETSRETRLLLSEAVAVFHDCFDPIVDSATERDFIASMVFGRNTKGQDFSGMYCAILKVNSSVVSAGILRIFGQDMAELPLVATRICNQGKGYFQLLFSRIKELLESLNVRSCVLPAADGAELMWTKKFGFRKIPTEQLTNYRKTCWQMITFKGMSMLEKRFPEHRIVHPSAADSDGLVQ